MPSPKAFTRSVLACGSLALWAVAAAAGEPYDLDVDSSDVRHLEQLSAERMLVFADGGLWVTDGSTAGTFQVPGSELLTFDNSPQKTARLGERIYFEAETEDPVDEVWWSDGDRVGLVAGLGPDDVFSWLLALGTGGSRLVAAVGNAERIEILGSDGDAVEPLEEMVREGASPPGSKGTGPQTAPEAEIHRLGDAALVFAGWNQDAFGADQVLWRSDGTRSATRRIADVRRVDGVPAAVLGGNVYFLQRGDDFGDEVTLWQTDGSAAGTVPVVALPAEILRVIDLQAVGSRIAILVVDDLGERLWLSDGTAAGTGTLPYDLRIERLADVAAVGGRLYLVAGEFGDRRLWQLDEASLTVERVIALDSYARIAAFGGVLYYGTGESLVGGDLWRTDGTAEGTVLLGQPGPLSAFPPRPAALGGTLFFEADDGIDGKQLWAVAAECLPSSEVLCLRGGRFQARSRWHDRLGGSSPGRAETLTAGAGYFWFFDRDLPELALKLLDGRGLNDHFWAFSGAATDFAAELHLFDTLTGAESRHLHPAGDLSSAADIEAFLDAPPPPAAAPRRVPAAPADRILIDRRLTGDGYCQAGRTTLCLHGARFKLTLTRRAGAVSVPAVAHAISDRAGEFSFFGGDHPDLIVKVLDGRGLNDRFWVFAGALTDVAFDLTVTDVFTGTRRVYTNPPGRLGGFADVNAFAEAPP